MSLSHTAYINKIKTSTRGGLIPYICEHESVDKELNYFIVYCKKNKIITRLCYFLAINYIPWQTGTKMISTIVYTLLRYGK